ncbi:transglycosylase SLT domain-containing protein [Aquibacillus albus]|uniref:Soluble lytic murein transglycosylase-like protein n=1 Tax=Aquibacillus albus TaxID=1168171 RepID=A0ABS2MUT3_9BACI|nr:transglycosylase SLT domain-containing protein [Aquibacillus albus]MBM7569646.1 soluble lytic murein transglycosylase-like protein [Aquibacillus albus]
MKHLYKILIIVVIVVGGMYVLSIDKSYKEQLSELKQENQGLKQENNRLKAEKKYLQTLQVNDDGENGYYTWPNLVEKAEGLVEASEGNFKKSWALYLIKESQKFDIDPYIVFELLKVETGGTFNPELVGPETKYGHAYGIAQFMKNTAPWIADMAGLPYKDELLFDPYYSMQLSIVYLDFLYHQYENWDETLTAYHRGIQGLKTYKKNNGHAKSDYAVTIQTNAKAHPTIAMAN